MTGVARRWAAPVSTGPPRPEPQSGWRERPVDQHGLPSRQAAQFLGRGQDLGTVDVGKLADLVLLDGSPLESIANTQRVNAVVRGGIYLDRAALDKLLSQAKSAAALVPAK